MRVERVIFIAKLVPTKGFLTYLGIEALADGLCGRGYYTYRSRVLLRHQDLITPPPPSSKLAIKSKENKIIFNNCVIASFCWIDFVFFAGKAPIYCHC